MWGFRGESWIRLEGILFMRIFEIFPCHQWYWRIRLDFDVDCDLVKALFQPYSSDVIEFHWSGINRERLSRTLWWRRQKAFHLVEMDGNFFAVLRENNRWLINFYLFSGCKWPSGGYPIKNQLLGLQKITGRGKLWNRTDSTFNHPMQIWINSRWRFLCEIAATQTFNINYSSSVDCDSFIKMIFSN